MAKIDKYDSKPGIKANDKWIGTDVDGGGTTKNFTAEDVADFLNSSGAIESNILRFTYQDVQIGDDRLTGTISFDSTQGLQVAFSTITTLKFSHKAFNGRVVNSLYLEPYKDSYILFSNPENPEEWAIYTWGIAVEDIDEANFWDVPLIFKDGSGNIDAEKQYMVTLLDYKGSLIPASGIQNPTVDGIFARMKAGLVHTWQALASNISSLTSTHITRLIALVFEDLTRSGATTPSSFEKGVATSIDYEYTIVVNDENITQIIWDGVTTSIAPFPLTGVANDAAAVVSSNRVLQITTVESGAISNLTLNSTHRVPQWRGVSVLTDMTGLYADMNTELTKVVQSGASQTALFSLTAEYVYFVSTKSNATITDGNNCPITIGPWGVGTPGFYTKSIAVTLADGSIENLTIYRGRLVQTANLTYNLF